MSQLVRLSLTILSVLTIMGGAGVLLWQQTDPRLADVEFVTNFSEAEAGGAVATTQAVTGNEAVTPVLDTAVDTTPDTAVSTVVAEQVIAETALAAVSATEAAATPADAITGVDVATTPESTTTTVADTTVEPAATVDSAVTVSVFGPGVKELCTVATDTTTTVHKIMLVASSRCGFTYAGKKQGNLGFFVEEIAGLKQSVKDGFYWVFAVNGEKSQLGVSTRTVEPNDTIQWTYEAEY